VRGVVVDLVVKATSSRGWSSEEGRKAGRRAEAAEPSPTETRYYQAGGKRITAFNLLTIPPLLPLAARARGWELFTAACHAMPPTGSGSSVAARTEFGAETRSQRGRLGRVFSVPLRRVGNGGSTAVSSLINSFELLASPSRSADSVERPPNFPVPFGDERCTKTPDNEILLFFSLLLAKNKSFFSNCSAALELELAVN
jgi:hypothetical protein